MVEISKNMKIVILINAIAGILYGIFYLIIPEVTLGIRDSHNYDPQFWRIFGATVIAFAVFLLVSIQRAEWDNIKILVELIILWLILIVIVNFITLATVPYSAAGLAAQWFDNIIIIILIIVDVFFYQKENK